MNVQPGKHLSIIDTYAESRHMERDDLVVVMMNQIMPKDKNGKDMATQSDLIVFLQIAYRLDLDPFTREIYCIPSRGKVIPYISIDGYVKMVTRHPECDGYDFSYEQDTDGRFLSVTCIMHRKDWSHPVKVTEFMASCFKPDSDAWRKNPDRMLRHRAFIQAARMTFGISGAFDEESGPPVYFPPIVDSEGSKSEIEFVPPRAPRTPPPAPNNNGKLKTPFEKVEEKRRQDDPDLYGKPVEDKHDPETGEIFDGEAFLTDLDGALASAKDKDELATIWSDFEVQANLHADKQRLIRAHDLLAWHGDRITKGLKT